MWRFIYRYALCHYAECRYAKCRGALANAPPLPDFEPVAPHWITVRRLSAENHLPDRHLVEKKTVGQSVCDQ